MTATSPSPSIAKPRLFGVDAARGIALIAMVVIHILPGWDAKYEPTVAWQVFAGRGAGLFALLAGVSLAFTSGGQRGVSGRKLFAARVALGVRAVLIMMVGLALGYLDIEESVILAYYGVMFLLAVPLLGFSSKTLGLLALGIAVIMPFVMQALRDFLPVPGYDPTFTTLFTEPGRAIGQLLLTGTYPALPWMAYICAGIAIGRLDLRVRLTQVRLLFAGILLALGAWLISALLMGPLGGENRLIEVSSGGGGAEFVTDTLTWGPDPTLPTDSLWWLASLAPYSSSPLVLIHTVGTSMAVLGAMLLIAGTASTTRSVLVSMGSMTLTLYSAHLLLLATGLLQNKPGAALCVHILLMGAFALIWRKFQRQGPMEQGIAVITHRARAAAMGAGRNDEDFIAASTPQAPPSTNHDAPCSRTHQIFRNDNRKH